MSILTSHFGDNADIFPLILHLFVPIGSHIADVTWGTGAFWRKVNLDDYNLDATDVQTGVDCRCLPYDDCSYDAVVLDPPYIYSPKGTIKESISKGYALNAEKGGILLPNQAAVLRLYESAIREANRVLRHGGVCIIKTKDTVESGKQVWMHCKLMEQPGYRCEDLFILTQKTTPTMDPKWGEQKHARKNHSYFIILRKVWRHIL